MPGLNTSKLAVIFNQALNVCLVCKSLMVYRDAFLFGLSLAWGLEVWELEQAQTELEATFKLCASLQEPEQATAQVHRGWDNSAHLTSRTGMRRARDVGRGNGRVQEVWDDTDAPEVGEVESAHNP